MNRSTALFFNGVFESVFTAILEAGVDVAYLQPHSGQVIRMLESDRPSEEDPIVLYASTSDDLLRVSYAAEIIRWDHKAELSQSRRRQITEHLEAFQPEEVELFRATSDLGDQPVNLLTVRRLRRLKEPFPTRLLVKESDGLPLKPRTRSGGWSSVHDHAVGTHEEPVVEVEALEKDLQRKVKKSHSSSDKELRKRLERAPKTPPKVRTLSVGYQRNPDVIVAVLRRARGLCELCSNPAPFKRRSDGSPYLEVHHTVPLSQGGEDTVENAVAVCPNCHREEHYG